MTKTYVLKTATGGYDGHGQKIIRSAEDLPEAQQLANSAQCVLEEFVNFDLEISVIVSGNGEDVTVFPVQENIHCNNILSKTIVPARISDQLADKAKKMAVQIAKKPSCQELSVWKCLRPQMISLSMKLPHVPTTQGTTQSRLATFHSLTPILGVLGAPLPTIHLHAPAVMLNVLGQHVQQAIDYVTENPSAHLHMYGKLEAKHNRKMGHVTVLKEDEVEFGEEINWKYGEI